MTKRPVSSSAPAASTRRPAWWGGPPAASMQQRPPGSRGPRRPPDCSGAAHVHTDAPARRDVTHGGSPPAGIPGAPAQTASDEPVSAATILAIHSPSRPDGERENLATRPGSARRSRRSSRMRAAARHDHCELARRTACGRGPRGRQPTTSSRVCPGSSHAGCRARSSVRHPAGYASRVRARDQFPIGPGGPALQGPLELVGRVRSLHRPGRRPASRGMSTRTNTVNNHQEEDRP